VAALSILLIAVGAIMAFAVQAVVDGLDLRAAGIILMVVGALGLVVSVLRSGTLGSRTRTERHVSDDGRHVVERSSRSEL
jgi:hypothetical protein